MADLPTKPSASTTSIAPQACRPADNVHERRKKRLSHRPLTVGYAKDVAAKAPDVIFIVEQYKFPMHSDVLCNISPAFSRMFRGVFKVPKVVKVTDTNPTAFRLFVQLIYEGTRSVAISISPKDSLDILILANKYLMFDLEEFLRKKLARNISYREVLYVLPFSKLNIYEWSIASRCWSIIERDTARVIQTEYFKKIAFVHLCEILENSRLSVVEFELFEAVRRWADYQRAMERKANIVEMIGVAVYKIRFPIMTPGQFDRVKKSGVLKPEEIADLEANFRHNKTYPNKQRKNICLCRELKNGCTLCTSTVMTPVAGIRGEVRKLEGEVSSTYHKVVAGDVISTRTIRTGYRPPASPGWLLARRSPNLRVEAVPSTSRAGRPTTPSTVEIPTCECFKYKSCPAYPNGATANVLHKLRLPFV